jgi:cell division protein FtsB
MTKKGFFNFFKNKFILTILIFIVWIFLFDSNNLLDRMKDLRHLRELNREKVYYRERIITDSLKLNELKTNNENLEKFAREQYLMKKDNEDIFIVIDKSK